MNVSTDELLRMIAEAGHAAYMNTLVGHRAPVVEVANRRMLDPRVGDLVLETSTFYMRPWNTHALGFLHDHRREPFMGRVEFCEMHLDGDYWDDPDETYPDFAARHTDEVWYLRPLTYAGPLTGTGPCLYRWHNASFIALPASEGFREELRRLVDEFIGRAA